MPPPPLPPAFHLDGLGSRHRIYVEPPVGNTAGTGPWPVLLCLDGDDQFPILCKSRATLSALAAFPPVLLVGIGYGASYGQPGNHRSRDYTPGPIAEAPHGGGADAFLDFLIHKLWPELARRYPVHADIRGIAGHSLGSLFALHALFKPAPFFNRVLASSPSVWWNERAILQEVINLQAAGTTLPAKLFLSVGLKDSESMVGDLALLEAQLDTQPIPGLEITRERFPEHDHYNAIGIGFRTGLTALFSP
ncbi:MAG TPA: alpha/beta hydrolase-fold protein [Rariglobus sp.]|jgi:predicted alpha/beta superfamily hydrolase|nr:alpha/beta hydrolase-fold protein [Rariglobus sp.]